MKKHVRTTRNFSIYLSPEEIEAAVLEYARKHHPEVGADADLTIDTGCEIVRGARITWTELTDDPTEEE